MITSELNNQIIETRGRSSGTSITVFPTPRFGCFTPTMLNI